MADAGGGVTAEGGAVLGLAVLVLLGLLIAPGVVPTVPLSGGQLALATAVDGDFAWPISPAVAAVPVPSTHGLISGTAPGVEEGPGVAVGAFPGNVPGLVPSAPGWPPVCELADVAPAPVVAWPTARPASARAKVTIGSSFCMRFVSIKTVSFPPQHTDSRRAGEPRL